MARSVTRADRGDPGALSQGEGLFISRQGVSADPGRILLMLVGTVLVLLGGALLVAVGFLVLKVMTEPSQVQILSLFLDAPEAEGGALSGHLGETRFSIGIDEPLRTLLFLVLGIWLVGALASILKTLVVTGKDLLMAGRRTQDG